MKPLKLSEARIIIFLDQTDFRLRYPVYMSHKLEMDYGYLLKLLKSLELSGFIGKYKRITRTYYKLKLTAPLEEARARIQVGESKTKPEVKNNENESISTKED